MSQAISIEELNQQLDENSDSVIWSQSISSQVKLSRMIIQIIAIVGFIILLVFFALRSDSEVTFGFNDIIMLSTYGFFISYEITKTYIFATLQYSIYPKHISFEWGFSNRKKVDIPFDDIKSVYLVEYDDSKFSTIHFGTNKTYDIEKYDFDSSHSRPHITFERIRDGKKVHDLLIHLQQLAIKK